MITKVTVQTPYGSMLDMPLRNDGGGLVVKSIEGLDPVKASLVSTGFAQMDGKEYQSSSRDERNIKIQIGIFPDYATSTVRDVRNRLYRYLMPKSEVLLTFHMLSGEMYKISGRVETFDTAMFSSDPAVDISIMCFNPDFYGATAEIVLGNTSSDPGFSAPIDYDGTVETGLKLTMTVNRAINEFSVMHLSSENKSSSMTFRWNLVAGDKVVISTVPGDKYVRLTHQIFTNSVLYAMSPDSVWTSLTPGPNNLYVYAAGAAIPYTIEYVNKYGGL